MPYPHKRKYLWEDKVGQSKSDNKPCRRHRSYSKFWRDPAIKLQLQDQISVKTNLLVTVNIALDWVNFHWPSPLANNRKPDFRPFHELIKLRLVNLKLSLKQGEWLRSCETYRTSPSAKAHRRKAPFIRWCVLHAGVWDTQWFHRQLYDCIWLLTAGWVLLGGTGGRTSLLLLVVVAVETHQRVIWKKVGFGEVKGSHWDCLYCWTLIKGCSP